MSRLGGLIATTVLAAALCVGTAEGGVIATEGFESYAVGAQLEANDGTGLAGGTGWTSAWGVNDLYRSNLTVAAQSLSYSGGGITIDGGSRAVRYGGLNLPNDNFVLATRTVAAQTGDLYFSFLFRPENTSGDTKDFFQVGFSPISENPRVSVGHGETSGRMDFFARVGTSSGNTAFVGGTPPLSQTYLFVAKVSKVGSSGNYDRVDLWVNPTSLSETPSTVHYYNSGINSGTATLVNLVLRAAFPESSDIYYVDEFVVGDTYRSVVPEPATLALLGAGLGLAAMRRKR